MGKYILTRLVAAIPTLVILTFVAFLLNSAARGDPAMNALRVGGQDPTPQEVAAYRDKLGLDDPLPIRYVTWVTNAVQGDFGRSFIDQREVSEILGERIVPTLRLGLAAFAFSTILGVAMGIVFGLLANSWLDHAGRIIALLLASIPSFWLALLLITYVAEKLGWLPVAGYGGIRYMILPVLALSLAPAAALMRFTRAAMIEVWRQDYVRTARAKGLNQTLMVFRHALPNALLPIITLIGLRFGQILAGAIVIEAIFSWPGMGSALIGAISGRDLPVIGAYVLLAGVMFITVNLVTDISYAALDPRIRLDGSGGRR
jgi:ABC-type dipeptide/oligopeptide/nickel transport system permease component